jgi:RNA polymerase sigma factor (sigma-70 family)
MRRCGGGRRGTSLAGQAPMTWLATIARNRAIDWRRASGRRPVLSAENLPEPADDAPLASDRLVQEESGRRLHDCLQRLGDTQREAIRTAFFEGLSYSELAERRGVPLGTAKSWIRRGLLSLRECLDDDA